MSNQSTQSTPSDKQSASENTEIKSTNTDNNNNNSNDNTANRYIILITGAARGIGFEFVNQYCKSPSNHIIAGVRDRNSATNAKLNELAKIHSNIDIIELDTGNENSIIYAYKLVSQLYKYINLLINNAGISNEAHPQDLIQDINPKEMLDIYRINVVGPTIMIQQFNKLVQASNNRNNNANIGKIINISSNLGSIATNTWGNTVGYRCSKTALNQITKCASFEYTSIVILSLHPGWVSTDMGTSFGKRKAKLKPETSINKMINVINNVTLQQTGQFIDLDGNVVPY